MSCFIRTTQNRKVKGKFEEYRRAVMSYFENGGLLYIYRGFMSIEIGERAPLENIRDVRPEVSIQQSPYATGYIADLSQLENTFSEKKREGILDYMDDNGIRIENFFHLFLKSDATIPGLTKHDMKQLRAEFLELNLPDLTEVSGIGEETAQRLELFCMDEGLESPEDVVAYIEGSGTLTGVSNVGASIESNIKEFLS